MTDDIDVSPAQTLDAPSHRKERSPAGATRATVIKSVVISVPLVIAIFVGLVALAVHNQQPDWPAYLAMAAGIGLIAGIFFGLLMGFTLTSHNFD